MIDPQPQTTLLVATAAAVYRLGGEPGDLRADPCLRADEIQCADAGMAFDAAALAGGELRLLGPDGPKQVSAAIPERVDCLAILTDEPPELLVGTLDARLYRVSGGLVGKVEPFDALDCRGRWHTPWGGLPSVRSLAATPDGWVYADIHVGSIMRSPDRGHTWQPVTPELHEDVHQVATCPAEPDRVYANTADGVYVSDDRGGSWSHRADDLDCRYGRAVAVAPHDPDLILATVSDGPHGENVHGQLYRSDDAGRSWEHIGDGFPASTAENIDTYRVAFTDDGLAWALADNTLHVGREGATRWEPVWPVREPAIMLAPRRQHRSGAP